MGNEDKKKSLTDEQIKRKDAVKSADPLQPFKSVTDRMRTIVAAAKLAGRSELVMSLEAFESLIPPRSAFAQALGAFGEAFQSKAAEDGFYDPGDNDIVENDNDYGQYADSYDSKDGRNPSYDRD